jgi:hypothetical protein
MDDLLEIILCLAAAAVIFGLRYIISNLNGRDQGDSFRWWLLPGRHTHEPGTPEIEREDEQRARVAQGTVRESRKARAEPDHSGEPTRFRVNLPGTTVRTPMYRGQPARLWWLPEQEIPKAAGDAARQTVAESMGCTKCGEVNPADSAFCGECGLFFQPTDSTSGLGGQQATGLGQRAAGSRRSQQ